MNRIKVTIKFEGATGDGLVSYQTTALIDPVAQTAECDAPPYLSLKQRIAWLKFLESLAFGFSDHLCRLNTKNTF